MVNIELYHINGYLYLKNSHFFLTRSTAELRSGAIKLGAAALPKELLCCPLSRTSASSCLAERSEAAVGTKAETETGADEDEDEDVYATAAAARVCKGDGVAID